MLPFRHTKQTSKTVDRSHMILGSRGGVKYGTFLTPTDNIVGSGVGVLEISDARKSKMKNEGFKVRNPLFIQLKLCKDCLWDPPVM